MMGSETKKCAIITISDDKTVEMMEPFEFIITFPPGQEAIDSGEIVPAAMQLTGIINIIDDDGELNWNEAINAQEITKPSHQLWDAYNALELMFGHFTFFYSEITVQFAQDMYMVRESDGMVDVMVVASERTSFSYMFTVTPMVITATSKLVGVKSIFNVESILTILYSFLYRCCGL